MSVNFYPIPSKNKTGRVHVSGFSPSKKTDGAKRAIRGFAHIPRVPRTERKPCSPSQTTIRYTPRIIYSAHSGTRIKSYPVGRDEPLLVRLGRLFPVGFAEHSAIRLERVSLLFIMHTRTSYPSQADMATTRHGSRNKNFEKKKNNKNRLTTINRFLHSPLESVAVRGETFLYQSPHDRERRVNDSACTFRVVNDRSAVTIPVGRRKPIRARHGTITVEKKFETFKKFMTATKENKRIAGFRVYWHNSTSVLGVTRTTLVIAWTAGGNNTECFVKIIWTIRTCYRRWHAREERNRVSDKNIHPTARTWTASNIVNIEIIPSISDWREPIIIARPNGRSFRTEVAR